MGCILDMTTQGKKAGDFLREFVAIHGDIKVTYLHDYNPQTRDCKAYKWVLYSKCPFLDKINVRELAPSEILLDFEADNLQAAYSCIDDLKRQGLEYQAWNSASGIHVHLFFPEMLAMDEVQRKLIRGDFIKQYNADLAKKAGVVALEYAAHFKNGKLKLPLQVEVLNRG